MDSVDAKRLIDMVDDEWYVLTKGEIHTDDPETCDLLRRMLQETADYRQIDYDQSPATDEEVARRVAAALEVMMFGTPD